jgi:hypothetical protein
MWLGFAAGVAVLVQRARGVVVQPFGLAFAGFLVSTGSIAYWLYTAWLFSVVLS